MASPSLANLPSEIILGICESLDDPRAITALDLNSRKLYNIWRLNTATMIKAGLPRAIDCFDLAQELVIAPGQIQLAYKPKPVKQCHNAAKKLLGKCPPWCSQIYNSPSLRVSRFGIRRPTPPDLEPKRAF